MLRLPRIPPVRSAQDPAPSIITEPASQTVIVGQPASFSVSASGSAPLRYQWHKNGTAIGGATSSSFAIPATTSADVGAQFTVVVSNSAGSVTSDPGILTANAASVQPSIVTQPVSLTVASGQPASFSVAASGAAPLRYQWNRNGTAIGGATFSSYTIPATTSADNGAHFIGLVSNSAGNVTSNPGILTINAASAQPSIVTQPVSLTVSAGQPASFSVSASGAAPLSYQWNRNGAAIGGATSSSYTTPATTSADSGAHFTVVVSNSAGNITSDPGILTVSTAHAQSVAITVSPNSASVTAGTTQQFAAAVTGTSNTAVTWTVSGTGCSGAACGTISVAGLYTSPASVPSSSAVTVNATSVADPTKSASATVRLVAALALALSISPSSASVPAASTQALTATLTGTSNTAVTWSLSGAGCSGASCGTLSTSSLSAVYTAPPVAPSPANVAVVVTSVANPTASASANIMIASAVVVAVAPTSASVAAGGTEQFSASVTGTPNAAVTWAVSGAGCTGAACGSISGNGLYTAPSTVPSQPGVAVVASSAADQTKSATANVTIAFATSTSASPTDGINIPSSHPRLFWNATRLAQAQHWWASHSYTPNFTNPNPFDPYDTLFACVMTNNSQWCNSQINWALGVNETSCYQTVGCDSMRVYGESVMLTYDWLYTQITTAQRATIFNNWNLWQTYLDTQNSWGNTGMPSNNYFAGAFRTDFSAGIATQGDNGSASTLLNYGLNSRWAALVNFDSPTGTGPLGAKGLWASQSGRLGVRALFSRLLRHSACVFRRTWA